MITLYIVACFLVHTIQNLPINIIFEPTLSLCVLHVFIRFNVLCHCCAFFLWPIFIASNPSPNSIIYNSNGIMCILR